MSASTATLWPSSSGLTFGSAAAAGAAAGVDMIDQRKHFLIKYSPRFREDLCALLSCELSIGVGACRTTDSLQGGGAARSAACALTGALLAPVLPAFLASSLCLLCTCSSVGTLPTHQMRANARATMLERILLFEP